MIQRPKDQDDFEVKFTGRVPLKEGGTSMDAQSAGYVSPMRGARIHDQESLVNSSGRMDGLNSPA